MVDVIIADNAFALRTFIVINAPVSVATGQQLFAVNLNAVHATMMPLVHVTDATKKFVLHVSLTTIENNVVVLIIDKVHRTNFFSYLNIRILYGEIN